MDAHTGDGLFVIYRSDGDGLGDLHATVRVGPFSGASASLVDADELRQWAGALRRYPWPDDAAEMVASRGEHETLRLSASTVGKTGRLGVRVKVSRLNYESQSPAQGLADEASVLVPTTYEAAHRFADDLATAIDAGIGEASLASESRT